MADGERHFAIIDLMIDWRGDVEDLWAQAAGAAAHAGFELTACIDDTEPQNGARPVACRFQRLRVREARDDAETEMLERALAALGRWRRVPAD